jgi:hypothetical protein
VLKNLSEESNMNMPNFLRPGRLIAGLAFVLSAAAFNPAQASVVVNWSGACTFGCTGQATATVTLIDGYTPGNAVNLSDVIQFDFFSNSFNFSILTPTSLGAGSSLPAVSGAPFFDIADGNYEFLALSGGGWVVGVGGGGGYTPVAGGDSGNFTATPEPSSMLLIGGGLAAVAELRRRKR